MSHVPVRLARTEVRRTVRTVVTDRTKLALYAVLGLFTYAPLLVFGSLVLSTAGEELVAGEMSADALSFVPRLVTGGIGAGFVGLTALATLRTVTTVADIDRPACLLLSTRLRNVVAGLVLTEVAFVLLWVGTPVLVLASAFAWGAGAPLVPLAAMATLAVIVGTSVSIGFLLGTCIRHLLTVYEPVARYRTLVFVLLGVAYFGSISLGWFDQLVSLLFDTLADSPLGWPGQLLLAGIPVVGSTPWQAAAGLAGAAGVTLAALAAGVRVGEYHWFADPVPPEEKAEDVESSDRLGALLSGVASRPVRTVAVTAVRRARRAPVRLAYTAYPLFGAFFLVEEVAQTGRIPTYAAVLLGVYVAWAAGALFALNLLGDHGPALPTVLTSTVSGREVVTGTALASVLCTLPLALVVAPGAGLLSPLDASETALLTAGTVVGVSVAPVLAVGIGVWLPRFGTVRITNNRHVVMPSKSAFLVYSLAVLLPVGAAVVLRLDDAPEVVASLLSALLSLLPAVDPSVPVSVVTGLAGLVLLAGVLAPVASVVYAVRRFQEYRPH